MVARRQNCFDLLNRPRGPVKLIVKLVEVVLRDLTCKGSLGESLKEVTICLVLWGLVVC